MLFRQLDLASEEQVIVSLPFTSGNGSVLLSATDDAGDLTVVTLTGDEVDQLVRALVRVSEGD